MACYSATNGAVSTLLCEGVTITTQQQQYLGTTLGHATGVLQYNTI